MSLAVSLWLCSGALRSVALRRGWWDGGLGNLMLKLAAGVVVGTSAAQAVTAALLLPALAFGWVQLPGGHADYRLSSVLVYWMTVRRDRHFLRGRDRTWKGERAPPMRQR
ncbi:hypothetical protein [Burkholderia ubonensis]|uniref:hypothetical protein n=1 Tax=Burkholderia ubonensis TaxID=101571 RepID=UPI001C5308D6|nr:hypothetical protein [Burkholderia ubonensis]